MTFNPLLQPTVSPSAERQRRPQMRCFLPLVLLAVAAHAQAAKFAEVRVGPSETALVLTYEDGRQIDAPKYDGQVGFQRPLISPDGQSVGWLALEVNCCTSYPIPRELVVLAANGRLRRFRGEQAIFGWCYVQAEAAVAYRQEVLHGAGGITFQLRRIADGKLLQKFVQVWDYETHELSKVAIPGWARCAEN